MAAFRSRRIEALLGAPLDSIDTAGIESLVANAVPEATDLDFKRERYGNGDSDKRDLATDVAALANTIGGVIIIGIEDDDQAQAVGAPGVTLSDSEINRMRQIVASRVTPLPQYDIIAVARPGQPAQGFYVLAVPRSVSAPHAVSVNDALRYPKRHGTTTRYLAEWEVATAYRERDAGFLGRATRLESIEADALRQIDNSHYAWIVVSLMPDLAGEMTIDDESFERFRADAVGSSIWWMTPRGSSFRRGRVGRRRFIADGSAQGDVADWGLMELHADGAGVYAMRPQDINEQWRDADNRLNTLMPVDWIVSGVISGLHRLGLHARDTAAAGGNAIVRAHLVPAVSTPALELGSKSGHDPIGPTALTTTVTAETVAELDALASPSAPLFRTGNHLANELAQSFGVPELWFITNDGRIRLRQWGERPGTPLAQWAEALELDVIDDWSK